MGGRKASTRRPVLPGGQGSVAAAAESERRYHDLLQHLPVGVYRTTASGRIIEANRALASILGCRRLGELLQLNVKDLYVRPRSRREHMRRLAAAGTAFSEFELRRRDGRTIWVRDHPRAVKDASGRVRHFDGILVDVSERKAAVEALRRSEQDYRRLFEHAHDAIVVFAVKDELILDVNSRACELYGFRREELIGRSLEGLSKDVARGKARIRRALREKSFRDFETVHFHRDGREVLLEVNAALITFRGRPAILSIHRDITRRRQLEEAIRQMAYRDPLTGLPNRQLLSDRLAQALATARRRGQRLTLLYIDLDGFKAVNDSCGHRCGDELLRLLASRLAAPLRRSDTVARLGGDEFLVLLPDAGCARDGESIARKLLAAIRRPLTVAGRRLRISASIGIALYPQDGRRGETLVKHADQAMYTAKTAGRNTARRWQARRTRREGRSGQNGARRTAGGRSRRHQPMARSDGG